MESDREALLAQIRASFWHRNQWLKWLAGGVVLLMAALAAVVTVLVHRAEPFLRTRIIGTLQNRFHARVELDRFHISLVRGLQVEGQGLRIWPPAQVEGVAVAPGTNSADPLIELDDFRFHAPLHYQPGKPFHISVVELKGLQIHMPPKSHFGHSSGQATGTTPQPKGPGALLRFSVDAIECTEAHFVLETSKPGKLPLDFAIARFQLSNIGSGGPMNFDAELTNPRPMGIIHSSGTFGPWLETDPGESSIQGSYRFDHADLASFKGIAGILSSTGQYQGTLRDLTVDGDTDTPDFRLTHFGNALPLHTHFHAKVDATNGDTWLEPVDATLGHSHFTAEGQVVRVAAPASDIAPGITGGLPPSKGHDIDLLINMNSARVEDFLRLASHSSSPLLMGALTLKARLHIPPGPEPVHHRLNLKGVFNLDQVRFSTAKIQDRIAELSLRGQGRPKEVKTADPGAVRSTMLGDFQMAGGVIALPDLIYTVPGATIQLKGTYGVDGGRMDFVGSAKLQATVSQVVGGWAGFLLKPADRIFRKDGAGTDVPIHIAGTREDPKFGIDFNRMGKASQKSAAGKP